MRVVVADHPLITHNLTVPRDAGDRMHGTVG